MPQVGDVGVASRERRKSKNPSGTQTVKGAGVSSDATEKEELTSGLGKGGAAATQAKSAPVKQNPGESLADYSKRLREQRATEATAGDQADALEKRRKKE